jgi:hypothetical protein
MKKPLLGSGFLCPQVLGTPGEQTRLFSFGTRRNNLQNAPLTGCQLYSNGFIFCWGRAFPCGGLFNHFAHIPSAIGY